MAALSQDMSGNGTGPLQLESAVRLLLARHARLELLRLVSFPETVKNPNLGSERYVPKTGSETPFSEAKKSRKIEKTKVC